MEVPASSVLRQLMTLLANWPIGTRSFFKWTLILGCRQLGVCGVWGYIYILQPRLTDESLNKVQSFDPHSISGGGSNAPKSCLISGRKRLKKSLWNSVSPAVCRPTVPPHGWKQRWDQVCLHAQDLIQVLSHYLWNFPLTFWPKRLYDSFVSKPGFNTFIIFFQVESVVVKLWFTSLTQAKVIWVMPMSPLVVNLSIKNWRWDLQTDWGKAFP